MTKLKLGGNEMKLKKLIVLALASSMVISSFTGCNSAGSPDDSTNSSESQTSEDTSNDATEDTADDGSYEPLEIEIFKIWQGRESSSPNPEQDLIAPLLKEKFNLTVNYKYTSENEGEAMNLMFAGGNLSPVIDFPFWGGSDVCTVGIKNAADDDMLLPLNDIVNENYPEMADYIFTSGYSKEYIDFELNAAEFDGMNYIIPLTTLDSTSEWMNGLNVPMVRSDILADFGKEPTDIVTSDDLLALLEFIRDGDYTDVNGNDILPSSIMGGSGFNLLGSNFHRESKSGFYEKEDGTYDLDFNDPLTKEMLLFYNKLYNEGLLDKESFSQTGEQRDAKLTNGGVGIVAWSGTALYTRVSSTLYETNPEMEYLPLASLENADGNEYTSSRIVIGGHSGSAALAFTTAADEEIITRVLDVIEYAQTDEGQLAFYFGQEGETYEFVDEQPTFTGEFKELAETDTTALAKYGIGSGSMYKTFVAGDPNTYADAKMEIVSEHPSIVYGDLVPVKFVDGYRLDSLGLTFDADKLMQVNMYLSDFNSVRQQVVSAAPEDAEAIFDNFIESANNDPVLQEYIDYVNEQAQAYDPADIIV